MLKKKQMQINEVIQIKFFISFRKKKFHFPKSNEKNLSDYLKNVRNFSGRSKINLKNICASLKF